MRLRCKHWSFFEANKALEDVMWMSPTQWYIKNSNNNNHISIVS